MSSTTEIVTPEQLFHDDRVVGPGFRCVGDVRRQDRFPASPEECEEFIVLSALPSPRQLAVRSRPTVSSFTTEIRDRAPS